MNQIGNNRQPYDGRRGRVDHFNTTEDQDKIRKKQEQQAYLQQLDTQMRMKKEREAREKKAIQDEERKYMAIGQNGVNNQQVSAQQEMFSRAGGINTSLQPPGASNYQQNRAGMAQYQPLSNNIPQQLQSQPLQQQQMPAFSRPQQTSNIGMPQGLPTSTAVNYNAPRSGRPIPQNYHDHLNNHMGLRHSNGDANQIYKQRFRDGIKDPAEIDALRERHAQQAKQNQLLAQQVADNKRRKEEALRKKKEEELAEEQRLQRQRDELKKQYEDEIASQKAKKEAQQKAMLDEQIQSKRKQKEAEARRERERVKKENERIQRDRAEMAKQYERETGKSPPKAAPQGVSQTPIRQRQPMKQQTGRGDPRGPANTASDSDKTMTRIKELETRLEAAEKRAFQNTRNASKPPGSAPAPNPVTPHQSPRRGRQPGNETIRKEQANLLRKHDNMRSQMEKQMRLIKEMQVKLDVRESEANRYQQELAKMKGMIQAEKQKNNNMYLDDFVHAQEKALHAEIDDELTRLLEGGVGPNTPKNASTSFNLSQFDTPKSSNTFRNETSGLTPKLLKK